MISSSIHLHSLILAVILLTYITLGILVIHSLLVVAYHST